jgi:hypothetical protein
MHCRCGSRWVGAVSTARNPSEKKRTSRYYPGKRSTSHWQPMTSNLRSHVPFLLKNGGTLEKAAQRASHASTRTAQLYDRRREELSLDEVERIRV